MGEIPHNMSPQKYLEIQKHKGKASPQEIQPTESTIKRRSHSYTHQPLYSVLPIKGTEESENDLKSSSVTSIAT